MTDLRTAAQQALEALEEWHGAYPHRVEEDDIEVAEALRAALAEPAQEPVGEVVAIDFSEESGPEAIVTLHQDVELGTMLYAAPPQRKPLSDDEIAQAMYRADAIFTGPMQFRFAREIERAHDIT